MASTPQTRDDRITLRLKHSAKLKLERAASLEGQTVSRFVLNRALARAAEKSQEHAGMALSVRDAEVFFDSLAAPVKFNSELFAALQEHESVLLLIDGNCRAKEVHSGWQGLPEFWPN